MKKVFVVSKGIADKKFENETEATAAVEQIPNDTIVDWAKVEPCFIRQEMPNQPKLPVKERVL